MVYIDGGGLEISHTRAHSHDDDGDDNSNIVIASGGGGGVSAVCSVLLATFWPDCLGVLKINIVCKR